MYDISTLNTYDIEQIDSEVYNKVVDLINESYDIYSNSISTYPTVDFESNAQSLLDAIHNAYYCTSSKLVDVTRKIMFLLMSYNIYSLMDPKLNRFQEIQDSEFNDFMKIVKHMGSGRVALFSSDSDTIIVESKLTQLITELETSLTYKESKLEGFVSTIQEMALNCSIQQAFDADFHPTSPVLTREDITNYVYCDHNIYKWISIHNMPIDKYKYSSAKYYTNCNNI